MHFYEFSFLDISITYRVFSNYLWPRWRVKRCCIFSVTYAERWVLTCSWIVSKKDVKYCKNYVFVWKISHSHVLLVPFTWVADQGPSSTVAFFLIHAKYLSLNLQLHDYGEERKNYLQQVFQVLKNVDSGKIFKKIIFSNRPRITHCTETSLKT